LIAAIVCEMRSDAGVRKLFRPVREIELTIRRVTDRVLVTVTPTPQEREWFSQF